MPKNTKQPAIIQQSYSGPIPPGGSEIAGGMIGLVTAFIWGRKKDH